MKTRQVRIIQDPDSKRCAHGCSDNCTSTTPLVSSCGKASEYTWGTDGDLLYRARINDLSQCQDKKEHFYLPALQHGTILVKVVGLVLNPVPPFKFYGLENSGRVEMI